WIGSIPWTSEPTWPGIQTTTPAGFDPLIEGGFTRRLDSGPWSGPITICPGTWLPHPLAIGAGFTSEGWTTPWPGNGCQVRPANGCTPSSSDAIPESIRGASGI